jgi:hypothetical protein
MNVGGRYAMTMNCGRQLLRDWLLARAGAWLCFAGRSFLD